MKAEDRASWGTEKPSDLVALDFECYYNLKEEVSLSKLSTWHYVFHPKSFPYLMSVKTEGFEWCGDPKEFDRWDVLHGKTVCAHNASFDELVYIRLVQEGVVPKNITPKRWVCTADLVAYLRIVRNLKTAVKELYDTDISKQVRANAEGKTADDMKAEGSWDDMVKYGMDDSVWCWKIACDYLKDWPPTAQYISQLNREASRRGFAVDVEAIRSETGALERLKNVVFEYGKMIPWYPDEPALSPIAFRNEARKHGLKVPASLAKADEAGQEFYEKYQEQYPWMMAYRNYRQATMMLRKVENLDAGIRDDGTFPYTSVYFGANTGRSTAGVGRRSDDDSGGKFNLYNLPREPLQGVDLRGLIVPRKGFKLWVGDYAQIEARLLLWRARDFDTLEKIASGYSIYEAEAERLLGIDGKGLKDRDPESYQMVKGTVLGSGYQMGPDRFVAQAPALTGGKFKPTRDKAAEVIGLYRQTHPRVTAYWARHQAALLNSVANGDETHIVELASGRKLTYYEPQFVLTDDRRNPGKKRKEIVVKQTRGDHFSRMYGGKLTENEMQATGYDILCDAWAAIADAGYAVVWTLYDEFVVEVPEKTAREDAERLEHLMVSSSSWAERLPLGVKWHIVDRYFK